MIFVNSMSDIFHAQTPEGFIFEIFDTMNRACWHMYQILTKRVEQLTELDPVLPWSNNIWMGVTVENADYIYRIDHLRKCRAKNKFISFEPLLGSVGRLNLDGIDWVIAGGESGPGARPVNKEWITEIRDQCIEAGVPFFFKQWGGFRKKENGRMLDGRIWNEFPLRLAAA